MTDVRFRQKWWLSSMLMILMKLKTTITYWIYCWSVKLLVIIIIIIIINLTANSHWTVFAIYKKKLPKKNIEMQYDLFQIEKAKAGDQAHDNLGQFAYNLKKVERKLDAVKGIFIIVSYSFSCRWLLLYFCQLSVAESIGVVWCYDITAYSVMLNWLYMKSNLQKLPI